MWKIISILIIAILSIQMVSAIEITSIGGKKANVNFEVVYYSFWSKLFHFKFNPKPLLTLPPYLESEKVYNTLLEFSGKPTSTPTQIKILVNKNGQYQNIQDYTIDFNPPSCFITEGCYIAMNFQFTTPKEKGKYTILANLLDVQGYYVGVRDSDSFEVTEIYTPPELCNKDDYCETNFRDTPNGLIKEVVCHQYETENGQCKDTTLSSDEIQCNSGYINVNNECIKEQDNTIPPPTQCIEECIGDKIKICRNGITEINDCGDGMTCVKNINGIGCQKKQTPLNCIDSDGDDIFTAGYVEIGNVRTLDSCDSRGNVVAENTCLNNQLHTEWKDCPLNKCIAGICLKENIIEEDESDKCIPLIKNGDSKSLVDVVFVAYPYTHPNIDFKKLLYNNHGILTKEPFKSNQNKFNWWYTDTLNTIDIKSLQNYSEITLNEIYQYAFRFCSFADNIIFLDFSLEDFRSFALPNYNIAFVDYEGEASVITHEFGHSFSDLSDEYSEDGREIDITSYNCDSLPLIDVDNILNRICKWNTVDNNCIQGCTSNTAYRSSKNSLMNNHYADDGKEFNVVSKNRIQEVLNKYGDSSSSTLNVFSIVSESNDIVYFITISNQNNILNLSNIKLRYGQAPDYRNQPETGNILRVINQQNQILYSIKFNIEQGIFCDAPKEWFDENGNQIYIGTCNKKIENNDLLLIIPYFDEANKIQIVNQNNVFQSEFDISNLKVPEQNINISFEKYKPILVGSGIGILSIFMLYLLFKIMKRRKR